LKITSSCNRKDLLLTSLFSDHPAVQIASLKAQIHQTTRGLPTLER